MGLNSSSIFGDKNIGKVLLKFALPAIMSLLVLELYNVVDTLFVGRFIGAYAIGALTVAFPVQRLMVAIAMCISVGASTYVARNLGKKNIEGMKKTIMSAFILTLVTIVMAVAAIFIFKKSLLIFLGASTNLYPLANVYISVALIGSLFQGLTLVACYIMTALGNTKITLYTNLLGLLCNVLFNFIFVVLLDMGIVGSALSNVIAQMLVFGVALHKLNDVKKIMHMRFTIADAKKYVVKDSIFKIIAVGFSTFIIEISDAVCTVVLNNLLINEGGDAAIVIIGIITKISMFMFIAIIGISSAMQPIVAYNYGAKSYTKMKETLKLAIIAVTFVSISFWAILMIFSNEVIGLFLREQQILTQAVIAFRICISVIPVIGVYYICIYYYQAINESKKSFLLSIYRQLVIFIPVAIILVRNFGMVGAWVAYPVSDIICFVSAIYFIKKATNESYEGKYVVKSMQILNN